MPELKSFPETTVRDLKVGDKTAYGEVLAKDTKVKWDTITFEGAAGPYTQRLEADQVIGCSREVPTAEEIAEKSLRRTLQSMDWKERIARDTLASARQKMISNMESGEQASHWDWMDVPLAEAKVALWDAVSHVHSVSAQHEDPTRQMTRVEAVRWTFARNAKQSFSYYSALSRSTGIVSNLFDDVKRQALSEWARDLEFVLEID